MRASAATQDMGTLGPALTRMALKEKAEGTSLEEDSDLNSCSDDQK
jgi:hypothetical protein